MTATLDKCPGYNLYIGGFIGLRRTQALKNCNITHIVSVIDWEFKNDAPLISGYKHLHIPVDDVEDENLLEWFPRSNRFIHEGLNYKQAFSSNLGDGAVSVPNKGSGVYIHCAMGKSRSATILLAYLLWASRQRQSQNQTTGETDEMAPLPLKPLSVIEALELLRQGRPIAEPNEGFMDQLHMFQDMCCPTNETDLKSHKIYRRWMNKRKVEESLRTMQAPEMENIIFEDESSDGGTEEGKKGHMEEVADGVLAPDGTDETRSAAQTRLQSSSQVTIKCRKCRHVLATTPFILDHQPPPHRDPSSEQAPQLENTPLPPPQCAHIFLHPLSWMREVLSEGNMEGRLSCPNKKCGTNLGKFAWTGLRCSCGGWVTPGFGLIRTKVDEITNQRPWSGTTSQDQNAASSDGAGSSVPDPRSAIRLPPGMKRQQNL